MSDPTKPVLRGASAKAGWLDDRAVSLFSILLITPLSTARLCMSEKRALTPPDDKSFPIRAILPYGASAPLFRVVVWDKLPTIPVIIP